MIRLPSLDVIYAHTEGAPLCIVQSGIDYPNGSTVHEKRRHLEDNYDWLRRALMMEPRGHRNSYGVFITPPSSPDTDAGTIWMCSDGFMHGCGHGTIAAAMAMVSTRPVLNLPEITTLKFDTTAGVVSADVHATNGTVDWCTFQHVPAYVVDRQLDVTLPGWGEFKVDIVFAGNFFGLVQLAKDTLSSKNGKYIRELGVALRAKLRETVKVKHPVFSEIAQIDIVGFYGDAQDERADYRIVYMYGDGQLSRGPGGTGASAMVALFEDSGRLKPGQTLISEGILGSGFFESSISSHTTVGGQRAVIPMVKGTSHIYGFAKWVFDPRDPLVEGFRISET